MMLRKTHWPLAVAGLLLLALVCGTLVAADTKADPDQAIKNLQFQSADIRSVLTFLSDYGQTNVVIAPNVEGTVTIKLADVHWRSAMDIIGRTYDLAVVDEADGYIRIAPLKEYRDELMAQEEHASKTRKLVALETEIIKVSNSSSDAIVLAVQSLLTERGKVTSDPRSNSIIVQEVPTNMQPVLGYIAELDKPAKQIKISAQLLEIFTNDWSELGIEWTAKGTYTTESGRQYAQEGKVTASDVTDAAGSYSVTALQHGYDIAAMVEAIVSSGKGKILAHPEITTIDNYEAKIQMGAKVPIKQFDEAGNLAIKFEEVGTILTVTPHITAEDQILMDLKPERSTYQFDPNGVIINTSNARTNVIVANGQTAVIGGLTTEDEDDVEWGVPILKDIPILGMLFKYKRKQVQSRDLVIFVTPTIVDTELASKG
ncbi:MAG: secretin N-terminal domain-containing protein [bacterium]